MISKYKLVMDYTNINTTDELNEEIMNCSSFRPYHSRNALFFAINVVLVSILCGMGIIGNIFNIVILSRRNYAKQSIIFIFLAALAIADMVTLAIYMPSSLSTADVFDPEVNYSVYMAYFHVIHYGLSNICKHSATWFIVCVAILRYLAICHVFRGRYAWTQPGRGLVMVSVVIVTCFIVNMPRFFELQVVQIQCQPNTSLYMWHYSEFSKTYWYEAIYPWISAGVGYMMPLFLVLVFNVLIIIKIQTSRYRRRELAPGSPNVRRQPDRQTTKMLVVVMLIFFILELPDAVAHVLRAILSYEVRFQVTYYEFILVANVMSLIHSSITFILYSAMSSEFRKTFHKTFCICDKKKSRYRGSITRFAGESTFASESCRMAEVPFLNPKENQESSPGNGRFVSRDDASEMVVLHNHRVKDAITNSIRSSTSSDKGAVWI